MRRVSSIVGLVLGMLTVGTPAGAEEVSLEALLLAPEAFQGEITVTGELVGDYGRRGDGWVWAQLNDDSYAVEPVVEGGELTGGNVGIGVRIPHDLVNALDPPGGYRRRGPLVELTGTWVYHDPGRGGESYLEVEVIEMLEPGRPLSEDVAWIPYAIGALLLAVAGALWSTRARET